MKLTEKQKLDKHRETLEKHGKNPYKEKGTKLTGKMVKLLADLNAKGLDNKTICHIAQIGETTYYKWLNKSSGLREAIEKAKSAKIDSLMQIVGDMAQSGKNYQAVKYLLARNRDEYSDKKQIRVTGENYNYNYEVKDAKGNKLEGIDWDNVLEENANENKDLEN